VLLQFTTLAWSRRGFPWQTPLVLRILQASGARCGVVFHDFAPVGGAGVLRPIREYCHGYVMQRLFEAAESAVFPVPLEKVCWLPAVHSKAIYIPVGANCPEMSVDAQIRSSDAKTVAVYCVTLGRRMATEVGDIGFALKNARAVVGKLRLVVFGVGSKGASSLLRSEFAGTDIEVETLGLLAPEEISRTLARADVMLFVRSEISSRRGSAIAGIAAGLPLVCYVGPDTGWPITEAGIVPVPIGDREQLSAAVEKVLADDGLRATLAERSRCAHKQYFSWQSIAARYADALSRPLEVSRQFEAEKPEAVARIR
jgi:glycosyltransferase involved in cell wall biosynthesis